MTKTELSARAIIAGDLYREGEIKRSECFRLEMDALLGEDSGAIRWCKNNEYQELKELECLA